MRRSSSVPHGVAPRTAQPCVTRLNGVDDADDDLTVDEGPAAKRLAPLHSGCWHRGTSCGLALTAHPALTLVPWSGCQDFCLAMVQQALPESVRAGACSPACLSHRGLQMQSRVTKHLRFWHECFVQFAKCISACWRCSTLSCPEHFPRSACCWKPA